jgi:hypothetical protein
MDGAGVEARRGGPAASAGAPAGRRPPPAALAVALAAVLALLAWSWLSGGDSPARPARTISPVAMPGPGAPDADRPAPDPIPAPADPLGFEGRVLDAVTGKPVAGATVELHDPPLEVAHLSAGTGEDGGFVLLAGRPGPAELRAWAQGYARLRRRGALPGTRVTLRLEPLGDARITVTAKADGAPVADAGVVLWYCLDARAPFVAREGRTDAAGIFAPAGLLPGSYAVVVAAPPGSGLAGGIGGVVAVPAGGSGERAVRLSIAAAARGTVLDAATGAPVAGAAVSLASPLRDAPPVLTGADGSFAIEGLPSDQGLHLSVTADGYAPEIVRGTPAQARIVRLERPRPFELLVHDAEGLPVPGAEVEAWWPGVRVDRPMARFRADAAGLCRVEGFLPSTKRPLHLAARDPATGAVGGIALREDPLPGASGREFLALAPRSGAVIARVLRGDVAAEGVLVRLVHLPVAWRELEMDRATILHLVAPPWFVEERQTGPDGVARFDAAPVGRVAVIAGDPPTSESRFAVREGAVAEVALLAPAAPPIEEE